MSLEKVSVLIIVTAQQQPQPQQYNKTTITVVGFRQKKSLGTTTHQELKTTW